jgi:hypothetical protein
MRWRRETATRLPHRGEVDGHGRPFPGHRKQVNRINPEHSFESAISSLPCTGPALPPWHWLRHLDGPATHGDVAWRAPFRLPQERPNQPGARGFRFHIASCREGGRGHCSPTGDALFLGGRLLADAQVRALAAERAREDIRCGHG